ncbi:MAG: polymorphic toxin-type HINT domain-containing protein [Candidatus Caenarcaniphilales bacterium]|nr:polymorphic toxin-type HINT domain-containing protein [Candidatus Caenarcaniphilales bacterium]
MPTPPAEINADNMYLGLDGNFTNTGMIVSEDKFELGTTDFINGLFGLKDTNTIVDPPNFLPGTIIARDIQIDGLGRFLNSGWIYAEDDLDVKAQKIENVRRTATRLAEVKEYKKGLFGGSRTKIVPYEEIQMGGILESGGSISLEADEYFNNKGGLIKAETDLSIGAPLIINDVQEGSRIVTWDPGWLGKRLGLKAWDRASVYQEGKIIAGGDVNLTAKSPSSPTLLPQVEKGAGTIINRGSDIISTKGNINIEADKLVEQNWVASHHTVSDKVKVGFFKVEREKKTEHVTRGSTIAALDGNVNINTDGTFRNIASDVVAGTSPASLTGGASKGNINITAKNIDISDAVHQSTNEYDSLGLNASASGISLDYQSADYTVSTHQSSNIIGSNNVSLGSKDKLADSITVTGSNIVAGNNLSISGDKVKVQNGQYTDTLESNGFSLSSGLGSASASVWETNASQEHLTSSNLVAGKNLTIDSDSTNIQSSNLSAGEKIALNSDNLTISGNWERGESNTDYAGVSAQVGITKSPSGLTPGVTLSAGGGNTNTESGNYISSSLSAPIIERGNGSVSGTIINGESVGMPNETSYSNTENNAVFANVTIGPGFVIPGVTYTHTENGEGFSGGLSSAGLNGSIINGDWQFGGSLSSPTESMGTGLTPSIYNSELGLGVSWTFGQTQGGSSHWFNSPTLLTPLGPLGGTFQEGNLVGVTVGPYSELLNPFQYTCFPSGTRIETRRKKYPSTPLTVGFPKNEFEEFELEIEKIKVGDEVLSFNEKTQELEWKVVLETFKRKKNKVFKITLVDKTLIKPTEEHPFFVSGTWLAAKDLRVGMKLLNKDLEEVKILLIEEESFESAIDVYNFSVEGNHNYFAEGVLVHNTYDLEEANEVIDIDQKLQSQEVKNPFANSTPVLTGGITDNSPYIQSLNDLIALTKTSVHLDPNQRFFYSGQLEGLKNKLKNAKDQNTIEEIQAKVQKIVLDLKLNQANQALKEDFITQEVLKNLNAAQETIKEIKKKINDKEQEKSLDEISNKVFWQSAVIQGVGWLKPLEKALKEWGILNKVEDHVMKEMKGILDKAKQEYVDKDIKRLDEEKKELLTKMKPAHGDPKYDPPIVLLDEEIYKAKTSLIGEYKTLNERLGEEKASLSKKLNQIKSEEDSDKRSEMAAELWKEVSIELTESVTVERKLGHSQNWEDHNFKSRAANQTTIPYYNADYKTYIAPYKDELKKLRNYHQQREAFLEEIKRQLAPEIPKNRMVHLGNMLSPVGADFDITAPFGSRFIAETDPAWTWREHKGIDLANGKAGDAVKATLSGIMTDELGDFGVKNEYEENGKKMAVITVYRHMPSSSYKFEKGNKVKVGNQIGIVGNQGTKQIHLHYEIWNVEYETLSNGEIKMDLFTGNPKIKNRVAIDPTLGYFPGEKK